MFVSAGNPVLSVPDGDALEAAFGELDLLVSLDFYVTDTSRHADYILPTTTFLEREDVPVAFMGFFSTPFVQVTDAVVQPRGAARQEWRIIEDLSRRIGIAPYSLRALRMLARLGLRLSPWRLVDGLLRIGPAGDWFGLKPSGLSLKKVARSPHGVVLDDHIATGVLGSRVRHPDRRVNVADADALGEIDRLEQSAGPADDYPLSLIGLRELRSHNSWMHNSPLLMRGGRTHALRIHPDRRRGRRPGRRRPGPRHVRIGLGGGAGARHRRDDSGHRGVAARLGTPRWMATRERSGRREREPACFV